MTEPKKTEPKAPDDAPRRRGRPTGTTRRATGLMHVRITDEQAQALERLQTAQKFPTRSALLRHLILRAIGEPTATPQEIEALRALRRELAPIGRNLNQGIRAMHERGADAPEIEALQKTVAKIKAEIGRYTTPKEKAEA